MKRFVSDTEFAEALYGKDGDEASKKAASDNRLIMYRVLAKYNKQLTKDELLECGLNALWKCLESHRDGFGQKFITSLHRFVNWKCIQQLQVKKRTHTKGKKKVVSLNDVDTTSFISGLPSWADDIDFVKEKLALLPEEYQEVISDYYLKSMTMSEIGKSRGYSRETARIKINSGINQLREVCTLTKTASST